MPRELTFRLNITTELGDGDEARPTIEHVTNWLTQQGYDSQVMAGMIERSHRWHGGITTIENAGQDDPEWSVACYDCDWTLAAPQSAAVATANQHTDQHNVSDPDASEYGVLRVPFGEGREMPMLTERCPGSKWATLPRGKARCADCGREFRLIGRSHSSGWGRTRLPNHKRADPFAGVRVKLWVCPNSNAVMPGLHRVEWTGNLATCLDCGLTNQAERRSTTDDEGSG